MMSDVSSPGEGSRIEFAAIVCSKTDSFGVPYYKWQGYGADAGVSESQALLPYGFYSKPLDAQVDSLGNIIPSTAATGLVVFDGDSPSVMPMWDPTSLGRIPHQSPGSVGLGCWTGAFDVFDGKAGSKYTYVPYAYDGVAIPPSPTTRGDVRGTPKKSHSLEFNVDTPGLESISLRHGLGMAINMTAGVLNSVVIKNASGSVYVEVNDQGIVLNGPVTINGSLGTGNPEAAQPLALSMPLLQALLLLNVPAVVGKPPCDPVTFATALQAVATQNTTGS